MQRTQYVLDGTFPVGDHPSWQLSWVALCGWQLSLVALVLGGTCPR